MLTQFFGSYLIDKKIITPEQLLEALRYKNTHAKRLGGLATAAGYMSFDEAEEVHLMQTQSDQMFAEIAVHMGYLTITQADELIQAQHTGYLLLGNAIIALGFCTPEVMSKAIADYEFDYQLSFSTILNSNKKKLGEMIQNYYHFPDADTVNPPWEYAALLLKNLIRFVGDDFRLLGRIQSIPSALPDLLEVNQDIYGDANLKTAIVGYRTFMLRLASRYACEDFETFDEYTDASLQDFLNLHNGIFTVNMSKDHNMECRLSPTGSFSRTQDISTKEGYYILPIEFTFGTVYFCFYQQN